MHECLEIFQERQKYSKTSYERFFTLSYTEKYEYKFIENSGIFIYLKVNFSEKSIVNCINFGFYHLFSSDFRFRCK